VPETKVSSRIQDSESARIEDEDRRIFRCEQSGILFGGSVPETKFSRRTQDGESARIEDEDGREEEGRAGLRLRILHSLPRSHRDYLYNETRRSCERYLRTKAVPKAELSIEELLSEVWAKLLGVVVVKSSSGQTATASLASLMANEHDPIRDGRVIWLLQEIGGLQAIAHRHEDILRRRHGRTVPGLGRPTVQYEGEDETTDVQNDRNALEFEDAKRIWLGLSIMAGHEFDPGEDVSRLLSLFVRFPNVFDDSDGQWPVARLVALLNEHDPPPDWRDRRVEDAKNRLQRWIGRLMRRNGLDRTDLEALFARVARRVELSNAARPTRKTTLRSVSTLRRP
jgi:hypothetical protein